MIYEIFYFLTRFFRKKKKVKPLPVLTEYLILQNSIRLRNEGFEVLNTELLRRLHGIEDDYKPDYYKIDDYKKSTSLIP